MASIGVFLARMRIACHITQADAPVRAGPSHNCAYCVENGDAGLAALDLRDEHKRLRRLNQQALEKCDFQSNALPRYHGY